MSSPDPPSSDATVTMHLAYAEASILLIESLILVLHERGQLALTDVMDAIDTVIDTKRQQVDNDEHAHVSTVAIGVLHRISNSLAASHSAMRGRSGD